MTQHLQRIVLITQASLNPDSLHQCALKMSDKQLPPGWQLVASSKMARVACRLEDNIYYKEFFPRSRVEKLKALIKGSRATRARLHSDALLLAGFQAPKSIFWGQLPGGKEYLFSHAVPGAGVTSWLHSKLRDRDPESLTLRRQLLDELGIFIGRLHATGFIHGDLRPSNVLAMKGSEKFQFSLIDNERNIRRTPAPGKLVLKNLMQLNMLLPADLTRSDRLRFFKAWHSQMRDLSEVEARLLAVQAYQWACTRLRAKGKL